MKNYLAFLLFLLSFSLSMAQEAQIIGSITDSNDNPVDFANVILNNATDSSFVKVEYSDQDGKFSFQGVEKGAYWVTIKFLSFEDFDSETFSFDGENNLDLELMKLKPAGLELDEVTITAKRPLLEMKPDKVIMNVAGSITASGEDGLSLLRKSPGVVVDNNENIMMLGKSGVQIYIDGKPSPLSGSDLAMYLKTLSADQIDAIEIITNPSAKYDAEGSAGIINIKLIRDKNLGANGSLNGTLTQGELLSTNLSFNGNYRTKDWYLYTNLGIYKGRNYNTNDFERRQSGYLFDQENKGEGYWEGVNAKIGVDHFIDNKNTIGIQFNISPSKGFWGNEGYTAISPLNESVESYLISKAGSDWESKDWNGNINYKYDDGQNRSFNIDLDHGQYMNKNFEDQPNYYLASDSITQIAERIFYTESPTDIDISTVKLDYDQTLLGGKLGVGLKYARVGTDNTFNLNNVIDGTPILDIEQSNDFAYTEKVSAAYLNFNKPFGALGVQLGLRMEHTDSKGELTAMIDSNDELVERSYTDFFPNLGLSYQLNDKNSFNFSYSRRLNRPSYQDLNPFRSRIDELTYEQGNPFLNPEYSNNFQLSHSWNYKINTSLSYTHTTDLITRIVDQVGNDATQISWLNLDNQKSYSINVSSPIPIKSWWNSYTSVTGVRTINKARFDESKVIDLTVNTFNIYSQHTFVMPSDFSFELSGWYSSPSVWGGNIKMGSMYSIDAGVQKSITDRLDLKVSVSDIFKTNKWTGESYLGGLEMLASGGWDSRRLRVNVKYRFGNDQLKSRKRKTGLESEKNRIKKDN